MSLFDIKGPLPDASFGAVVRLKSGDGARSLEAAMAAEPQTVPGALADAGGLLLVQGLHEINDDPAALVRLSRSFGPEVEDYRRTLTDLTSVHSAVPEIMLVSNVAPVNRLPPPRPEPPLTADGKLPVQYPHRTGWHTDQSYRRPPPDISLFYAASPVARGRGQTLFASGILAYEALAPDLKRKVDNLEGLHAQPGTGRSRKAALAGEKPRVFAPHQRSQRQPVVREHPVTGKKALYLCEGGQMDWFEGPLVGMEPGPNGEGAKLVDLLMSHMTQRRFVYVHEWTQGDMLIWDNRCLVHAATWYEPGEQRMMWRTTVHGNPGATYAGEAKSWIPAAAD
ncbi:MAG TPA: TauD/TfdA family dioxygenase [Reyranella sp.]|jgi:taurine dioxygenase|nr:TauD/TfdA family dioxygenase [Reyranella sp.]